MKQLKLCLFFLLMFIGSKLTKSSMAGYRKNVAGPFNKSSYCVAPSRSKFRQTKFCRHLEKNQWPDTVRMSPVLLTCSRSVAGRFNWNFYCVAGKISSN